MKDKWRLVTEKEVSWFHNDHQHLDIVEYCGIFFERYMLCSTPSYSGYERFEALTQYAREKQNVNISVLAGIRNAGVTCFHCLKSYKCKRDNNQICEFYEF